MSRSVNKFKPGSPWKIGVTESWLNAMAKKGLFIEKMGKYFATFKKGEPSDMYYRIEMSKKNDGLSEEQIRVYKIRGWDYVTNYNIFHIFSSPYEFNTTEVHIIPEEYAEVLKPFYKKSVIQLLISLAILFSFYIAIPLFIAKEYVTILVNMSFVDMLSQVIIISTFINALFDIIYIGKLRMSLLKGTSVNHNSHWKLNYISSIIISSCLILLTVGLIVIPFTSFFTNNNEKTLPDDTFSIAIVRLKEVENQATLKETPKLDSDEVDYNRRYREKKNFFAPLQYTSNEFGSVMINPTTTYVKSHDTGINNEVYKVRFKFMAEKLLWELCDKYKDFNDINSAPLIIEDNDLDLLAIYRTTNSYAIFACKGKGVMQVVYSGKESEDKIISVMKEKLSMMSE